MDLFSDTERKVTIRISELGSVEHAQRLIKEHKIDTELDFIAKFPFHYAALTPNSISLRVLVECLAHSSQGVRQS